MKRQEKLKVEKDIAENLSLLPAQMKQIIDNYYQREIDGIDKYGFDNPDVDNRSLLQIKKDCEGYKAWK